MNKLSAFIWTFIIVLSAFVMYVSFWVILIFVASLIIYHIIKFFNDVDSPRN